ncbi:MAG: hypothetical protein K6F57_03325 [Candidatus Saccharibacteria bacterium]|nr:hypothetical protein [Candidatus Saccharibacteria bacterium]
MRNPIDTYWQPEFANDPKLISLRRQLRGVLASYKKMLNAYGDAENPYAEKEAERKLEDKTLSYNERVWGIEQEFKSRVFEQFGVTIS